MDKVSSYILAVLSLILIPLFIAEFRYRTRCSKRFSDIEGFHLFLKTYLLKDAVLKFHSPDPRHREADSVIEKLITNKELHPDDVDVLVTRIKERAINAEDKRERLQAAATLYLMDEFMEAVVGHKPFNALAELDV